MAGISTVKLAAQVTNYGGLGSLPFGSVDLSKSVDPVRQQLEEFTSLTNSTHVNINFFCHPKSHQPAPTESSTENWHRLFSTALKTDTKPLVPQLSNGNVSFKALEDSPEQLDKFFDIVGTYKPKVVSFHFGLPEKKTIERLQQLGSQVWMCVTSAKEAEVAIEYNVDGLVAQGFEAGGHRGNFLDEEDTNMSTEEVFDKVKAVADKHSQYVIPAGGIVNGSIAKQYLAKGAPLVVMGSVFVPTPETNTTEYLRSLLADRQSATVMTGLVSGKRARCLRTPFIDDLISTHEASPSELPAYGYSYYGYKTANLKLKQPQNGFYLVGDNYKLIDPTLDADGVLKKIDQELLA